MLFLFFLALVIRRVVFGLVGGLGTRDERESSAQGYGTY